MFEDIILCLPIMAKIGSYLGIVGGLFNCMTSTKFKVVGFSIWIISNCILISWAYCKGEYEMAEMYAFFFVTSGIGLYTHWKLMKKEKEGNSCVKVVSP